MDSSELGVEKVIVDIEFTALDGRVEWHKKYADGSQGPDVAAEVDTDDRNNILRLIERLRKENNLEQPPE